MAKLWKHRLPGIALAILWLSSTAPVEAIEAEAPAAAPPAAAPAAKPRKVDAGLARGAVVKASPLLFGYPDPTNAFDDSGGAVVVITQDERLSDADLEALAAQIGTLASGTPPEDPELKALADFVRPDFKLSCKVRPVPAALTGGRSAHVARCSVSRAYLPDYRLDGAGLLTFQLWKRGDEVVQVAHCRPDGSTKIKFKDLMRY